MKVQEVILRAIDRSRGDHCCRGNFHRSQSRRVIVAICLALENASPRQFLIFRFPNFTSFALTVGLLSGHSHRAAQATTPLLILRDSRR